MEFDEMKKIWDAQNNQPLYTIDEEALRGRIQRKKNNFLVNIVEWLLIISYLACSLLVGVNSFTPRANIFVSLVAAWMFAIVVYLAVIRIRRIKGGRRFDRSIHGDLDHAIYLISYQMRIARVLNWNLLPVGVLIIFSVWETGKLLLISAVILAVYSIVLYASSKSLSGHRRRKRALQVLKEKLENSSI